MPESPCIVMGSVTLAQLKGSLSLTVGIAEVGSFGPVPKHGSLLGLLEVSTMDDWMNQGLRETGTTVRSSRRSDAMNSSNSGVLSLGEEIECTGSTGSGDMVSSD